MVARQYFMSLDFGTYASGFAFAYAKGDPVLVNEHARAPFSYPKNITTLLYEKKPGNQFGSPKAWGWDAKFEFIKMTDAERSQHVYEDNFKLSLASGSVEYTNVWKPHVGLPGSKLIADYLRLLATQAKEVLKRMYTNATPDKIMWAMTVPAEWSEAAKESMRKAAFEAGITDSLDSDALVLLYEPEAAALYAKSKEDIGMDEGKSFIIIDAGGGTTDITMHDVQKRGTRLVLDESAHRAGLMVGGQLLDEGFEAIWKEKVGDAWRLWKEDVKNTKTYMGFMGKDWNEIKTSYTVEISMQKSAVLDMMDIPQSLGKCLDAATKKWIKSMGEDDFHFPLDAASVRNLFDKAATQIITKTREVIRMAGREPDTIILVGGLGSNKYLAERVQKAFAADVFVPPHGYAAILAGGVLYAQNPSDIAIRRSRYTYGIETGAEWKAGDPPTDYIKDGTGQLWCRKVFQTVVQRNEPVALNRESTHAFTAAAKEQASVSFKVFRTEKINPRHTEEEGMILEAEMILYIDDPKAVQNPTEYEFVVTLRFGGTEFIFTALDKQTRKEMFVKVAFSHGKSAD